MSKKDDRADHIEISTNHASVGTTTEDFIIDQQTAQRYWSRLKKITVVWMVAWMFPAVLLHIPIAVTSSIKIMNGIPLHWFNAALLSILIGVVLIFLYAFVMDKTDRILKGAQKPDKGG